MAVNGGGEKRGAAFRPPFGGAPPAARAGASRGGDPFERGIYIYIYIILMDGQWDPSSVPIPCRMSDAIPPIHPTSRIPHPAARRL